MASAKGTFVSVGNGTQHFDRLLNAVEKAAPDLPQPIHVQNGHTPFTSTRCHIHKFLEMGEFERMVAEAELLILHAGAGSVIHAVRSGKVPVVMPRLAEYGEHIDDHQVEFANVLADAGFAVAISDADALLDAARQALALQRNLHSQVSLSPMVKLVGEVLANYEREFA